MNIRYRVDLSEAEQAELKGLVNGGRHPARKVKRAQILLAAHDGVSDEDIARTVSTSGSTVYRTKRHFVEGNLELALNEDARPGAARKLAGKQTALLVATACSGPPAGRQAPDPEAAGRGDGPADRARGPVARLSREADQRPPAPGRGPPEAVAAENVVHPQIDGTYVARMEDVLDLYAEEADPRRPVVCFYEIPTQLIGEVRQPTPAEPGRPGCYDCEYRRNGTANLFVFLDAHKPWRHVKVTDHRKAGDFAACMRDLVDTHYPGAAGSASCWTTSRPTLPAPCTRRSPRPRHVASCDAWSSTTRPNMPPG